MSTLSLFRVGRAGSSHTARNLSALAVTVTVCLRVIGERICHALAWYEKGRSCSSREVGTEGVDASILTIVILNTLLVSYSTKICSLEDLQGKYSLGTDR